MIDMAGQVLGGGVKAYAKERKEELEALVVNAGAQKMYAPGRLLLLDDATGSVPRLAFAEATDFDRLLIHSDMVPDHLPMRYLEGIATVLRQLLDPDAAGASGEDTT